MSEDGTPSDAAESDLEMVEEAESDDGTSSDSAESDLEMVEEAESDGDAATRAHPRARMVAAALLGIVSATLIHTAILGAWTIRTATDSAWFEDQIVDILQSEEVSSALAEVVLEEVSEPLDIRGELVAIAPESVEPLIDVLLAGLEARLEDRLAELIREPAVSETVGAIAGRAHALAIDVLEGERLVDIATVEDGQVRLNLVPLAARAIGLLPELGVLSDVEVPEFEAGGDPKQQVAELEEALDVELADDFAQPTIFTSDTLAQTSDTVDLARSLLLLAKRGFWLLFALGIAAGAGSLYFSRRRVRSGVILALGVVIYSLLTRATVGTVAERVPEAVAEPGAKATVREVVVGLQSDLNRTLLVSSLLALVALGIGVYTAQRWPLEPPATDETADADEPDDPAEQPRSTTNSSPTVDSAAR